MGKRTEVTESQKAQGIGPFLCSHAIVYQCHLPQNPKFSTNLLRRKRKEEKKKTEPPMELTPSYGEKGNGTDAQHKNTLHSRPVFSIIQTSKESSTPTENENMDRKRALHFLSLGLSTGQVASIVGVSPGRISQFISEPEIKAQLEIASLEGGEKTIEEERIEAKQTAVKNDLLDALSKRSNEASFMEIAKAYEIVCRAESIKRNNVPMAGTQIFNGAIVQISMPQKTVQEVIEITNDREVISVGGRELAPMPSGQVIKLFRSMKEQDHEQLCLQSSPIEGHC